MCSTTSALARTQASERKSMTSAREAVPVLTAVESLPDRFDVGFLQGPEAVEGSRRLRRTTVAEQGLLPRMEVRVCDLTIVAPRPAHFDVHPDARPSAHPNEQGVPGVRLIEMKSPVLLHCRDPRFPQIVKDEIDLLARQVEIRPEQAPKQ